MSLRGHPGIGRPAGHGHAYASPGRPGAYRAWVVAAFLLGTIARGALGDPDTAGRALQSALDLTQPDQVLSRSSSTRRRAFSTAIPDTTFWE